MRPGDKVRVTSTKYTFIDPKPEILGREFTIFYSSPDYHWVSVEENSIAWAKKDLVLITKQKENTMEKILNREELIKDNVYNFNGNLDVIIGYDSSSDWPFQGMLDTYSKGPYPLTYDDKLVTAWFYGNETLKIRLEGHNDTLTVPFTKDSSYIKNHLGETITKTVKDYIEEQKQKEKHKKKLREKGASMVPEFVDIEEVLPEEEVKFNPKGSSTQEKYTSIVGTISKLTESINKDLALDDNKELVEAFISAKETLNSLANATPKKIDSLWSKYVSKIPGVKSSVEAFKETKTRNDSTQDTINELFGIIHDKYQKLIKTGEGLQKAKSQISTQMQALETLEVESDKEVSSFGEQVNVPIRILDINNQIKASIEKYRDRLLKIDGAILATQSTILALGKELPAYKTDLIDESAILGLLSNVDDYQKMYHEITELVSNVTNATAEKTHQVVETLMDLQIKDSNTITHLAKSAERGQRFAAMLTDKSTKFAEKVQRDAIFIKEVANGNTIANARASIKMLE